MIKTLFKFCIVILILQIVVATCPGKGKYGASSESYTFADMHDGDEKAVTFQDNVIIQPTSTEEDWKVVCTDYDASMCTFMCNFNVSGKPDPPPVPLMGTVWGLTNESKGKKISIEWTDPTETISPSKNYPINAWIEVKDSN